MNQLSKNLSKLHRQLVNYRDQVLQEDSTGFQLQIIEI